MEELFSDVYNSPVGLLWIKGTFSAIRSISYVNENRGIEIRSNDYLKYCIDQLDEYFYKKREVFDLVLQPNGSDFQKKVWDQLSKIPFGKTITYLQQSKQIGDPKAIRAVAKANSQNKIVIVIPCHRVIGIGGKLIGYGGGLWRKKWLLDHENPERNSQISFDF